MSSVKVHASVIDPDAHLVENERVWDYIEKRSGGQGEGKPVRKQFLLFVLITLFLLIVIPTHRSRQGKSPA